MGNLKIVTDNHYRELITGFVVDMSPEEKQEFDYQDDFDSEYFFKYKKQWYALDEFLRLPEGELRDLGWHASEASSAFSGMLIALSDDNESIKVGEAYLSDEYKRRSYK